jgi:hypothetical protein
MKQHPFSGIQTSMPVPEIRAKTFDFQPVALESRKNFPMFPDLSQNLLDTSGATP